MTQHESKTPESEPAAVAIWKKKQLPRRAIAAAMRGDRRGLLDALSTVEGVSLADIGNESPGALRVLNTLAEMTLDLRRQSVAAIGNHEAFVRHTPNGSLHQVIRPVRLSVTDKTLFQIRAKRPVCIEEDHQCFGTPVQTRGQNAHRGRHEWREVVLGDADSAIVTYPGYLAMNAVAGCAVGLPPSVDVDGETRTNPYVQREGSEVIRIVVGVVCVGATPATGNPVVVNYRLDYDPQKDLAHGLLRLREDSPDDILLIPTRLLKDDDTWGHLQLAAGVSIRYNLALAAVFDVFQTYVEIQANALKKALTVARRNAMKSHPALGVQAVRVDANGQAVVPVTGWAGDDSAMRRWEEIQAALSRGLPLPEIDEMQVMDIEEEYDPDKHDAGLADAEVASPTVKEDAATDGIDDERGSLMAYIDQGLALLSPSAVASLEYDPDHMTVEQLRTCRDRLDGLLDQQ